ncbi:hypothetical protein [Piscinibacterium candidicorallinum]|uniref:Uncharacterized protein n=1 Tax=Piscinibacterium candidicorallinum TaxID=1793872 RepID=A0ABV7H924_9BURK
MFPDADQGMQDFIAVDGWRVTIRYAEGYFASLAEWINAQR